MSETDALVIDSERDDQIPLMDHGSAGVDDVGHVAVTLTIERFDQWLFEVSDHSCRIIDVEQDRRDRVAAHRADGVGEDEPAVFGFDR